MITKYLSRENIRIAIAAALAVLMALGLITGNCTVVITGAAAGIAIT